MSASSSVPPGISGWIATISKLKTGAAFALALFICAVFSACSPSSSTASQTRTPMSTQPSIGAIAPLPPGSGDRPLQPGQNGTEYTPDGLPALAPAGKSPSADQLFAEKMSDDKERFKRLENAVADLRREFDAVKPAIVRLTAVEADMEELVTQLQTLVPGGVVPGAANINDTSIPDIGPMPDSHAAAELAAPTPVPAGIPMDSQTIAPIRAIPPVSAQNATAQPPLHIEQNAAIAPLAAIPSTKVAAQTEPLAPGKTGIQGVRIADHGTSTRIVIDVSAKTPFTFNVDNTEHLLMIELPGVALAGTQSGKSKSPLAPSWTASADGHGVVIAIDLLKNAAMAATSTLPAGGGAPYRIVFDLKPSP